MSDKPREEPIHLAAQCWCDEETSSIEMDTRLAMAFAKRYDKLLEKCANYEETLRKIARDTSNNQDFYLQSLAREALGE